MVYLQQARIQSVLVEGGAQLLHAFLEADLWDEARVLQSQVLLKKGVAAPIISASYYHHQTTLLDNQLVYFHNT
jgi:diaminohydroxyphosphoribosylaminopyrimidine deaminase/5-amino-6-(5-phosphoribosylamino)uracil reductase